MAWQDSVKKGLWLVGANFCGSTRCQAKLKALEGTEEEKPLINPGASASTAKVQETQDEAFARIK